MIDIIAGIIILTLATTSNAGNVSLQTTNTLSQTKFSLNERYADKFVNDVFKDNILLTIKYMTGEVKSGQDINWEKITKPFTAEIKLKPNEVFAFHEDVLPEYQGKVAETTKAHFNSTDGFKSDGYLVGDGVCHLASLMNLAAKEAGLEVKAPTSHDFANIPEVPKEYGTSIYYYPGQYSNNALQNLYIKNNKNKEITFKFEYDGEKLKVNVVEL